MDNYDFFVNADLSISFCKIIFSIQELEKDIKELTENCYDKYNKKMAISECIEKLADIIPKKQRNTILSIIKLRNYLVHEFFYDNGIKLKNIKIKKYRFTGDYKKDFDLILKIIFELHDYIDNKIENDQLKRPNIIENNYEIQL